LVQFLYSAVRLARKIEVILVNKKAPVNLIGGGFLFCGEIVLPYSLQRRKRDPCRLNRRRNLRLTVRGGQKAHLKRRWGDVNALFQHLMEVCAEKGMI